MQHAMDIDGNDVSMGDFAGKVVLVVNVASACGYTEQNYKGLQALYEKYGSYGLEIIAFPSNQFGGQEPGTEEHIKQYVTSKYNVTFRMMSKVDVNGPNAHPIFKYALIRQNMSTYYHIFKSPLRVVTIVASLCHHMCCIGGAQCISPNMTLLQSHEA